MIEPMQREFFLEYQNYELEWDRIYDLFSKEAVQAGSLDRFAEQPTNHKGTKSVDAAFLKDMETFRLLLAGNIAQKNPHLSSEHLNYAVQMTLNRILFLRISEDRGIEPFEQLKLHIHQEDAYARLCKLFLEADDRYNSGLFHFRPEKGRATPTDDLTLRLIVDDEPLRQIIDRLYFPCPYKFEMIPIEIMGQVYEQFMGRVVEVDNARRVRITEKPEVRKAGGVFYTPAYIVKYIVDTILDKTLDGKSTKDAASVRLLDVAAGSGSFLVRAYRYLLDWHRAKYLEDLEKNKKVLYQDIYGDWQLTTSERKRILTNSIFGVDIDPHAVENTKLALLMMVLEGATSESVGFQLSFARERALPDLDTNIKCGNSLIDYSYQQLNTVTEEEFRTINPFDWNSAFPDVMRAGGFDVVIGNPPYIRIQMMKEWAPSEVEMYKQGYVSARKGNYDKYIVFIEKGLLLLKDGGLLGFIVPHKFFNAQYGQPLRQLISNGKHLSQVVHFGDEQVFVGATTYTTLLFLDKSGTDEIQVVKVDDLEAWRKTGDAPQGTIQAASATGAGWNFTVGAGSRLFARLSQLPSKLKNITERIAQGIRTSANEVFVLDVIEMNDLFVTAHSKRLDKNVVLERASVALFLQGRDIKPFSLVPSRKVVIIPYRNDKGRWVLIPEGDMRVRYPSTYAYLLENKRYLEERENGRMHGTNWYGFIYPKNIDVMSVPKILVPDIADRGSFALDELGEYAFTSGYGITLKSDTQESLKYVLGLLNSNVLDFYLKQVSTTMRGGYFRYFTQFIEQLPIPTINFSDDTDRKKMVKFVQTVLDQQKQLRRAVTPNEKARAEQRIRAAEGEINLLVYGLYGLTEQEIRLVEGMPVLRHGKQNQVQQPVEIWPLLPVDEDKRNIAG
jgi:hypothetical protein